MRDNQTNRFFFFIAGSINIPYNARWKKNGVTVAGGKGPGDALNQLSHPHGLYVDDDQTVYVADYLNSRIMKWKSGAKSGKVVAGGNGRGDRIDQLDCPTGVIVDKETDSLIICDNDNRRVMRWSCQSGRTSGEIIIDGIRFYALAMDNQGFLYVTDGENHEVKRYGRGETQGTVVAGGNGEGSELHQLRNPDHVFIDQNQSVYVSEMNGHRVMKWMKDAKEGMIVAGSQEAGSALSQLNWPRGVFADQLGTVYVADSENNRIMRWSKGMTQGDVIAGEDGTEAQRNSLVHPVGLSFDRYGNLYVVDYYNHRVQRFSIEETVN